MTKKEKIFTLILNIISLLLIIAVVVPYGADGLSELEVTLKCLVYPIIAFALFVFNSYVRYIAGSSKYKYNSFSAYLSVFGYVVALLAFVVLMFLRAGDGAIFATKGWLMTMFLCAISGSLLVVFSIFLRRLVIRLTVKENIFFDFVLAIALLLFVIFMRKLVQKGVGVAMNDNLLLYIYVPLLLTLIAVAIIVFVMYTYLHFNEQFTVESRRELIEKWYAGREKVYNEAKDDILFSLYLYSKEELGIYDELDLCECEDEECECEECEAEAAEEAEDEKPAEVEAEAAFVPNEENEANKQRLAELQKQKEELTAEESEEEPAAPSEPLPEKTFLPSFSELVKLAKSFKDVTYNGNSEGTNYRFSYKKKVFLILADTPKDYRMVFLMDNPEAAEYSQLVAFSKAKSPKGDNYFKIVNRGEFTPEQLFAIVRNAYNMVDVLAERARIAKEEEKQRKAAERLQAKFDAMTPEQRAAYYARLEKKRQKEALEAKKAE